MINQIMLGDCFLLMETLPKKSFDLILTDPPYNISKHSYFSVNPTNEKFSGMRHDFGSWDKTEIDLERLFSQFYALLKPGGTVIIFYDIWKGGELKDAATSVGFKQPRVCQWVKTNPTPLNSKKNYLSNSVEFFFTFVKGKKPIFNSEYDKGIYNFPLPYGKTKTNHPTEKPLDLFKALIEKHSTPNNLVLDPFAGSGTTGIACKDLDRNYILIEKEIEFFDLCNTRINPNSKI